MMFGSIVTGHVILPHALSTQLAMMYKVSAGIFLARLLQMLGKLPKVFAIAFRFIIPSSLALVGPLQRGIAGTPQ